MRIASSTITADTTAVEVCNKTRGTRPVPEAARKAAADAEAKAAADAQAEARKGFCSSSRCTFVKRAKG